MHFAGGPGEPFAQIDPPQIALRKWQAEFRHEPSYLCVATWRGIVCRFFGVPRVVFWLHLGTPASLYLVDLQPGQTKKVEIVAPSHILVESERISFERVVESEIPVANGGDYFRLPVRDPPF
jgi:hypothetical protein